MMKTNKLDIKNFICIASVGKPRGLKGDDKPYQIFVFAKAKIKNQNFQYIKRGPSQTNTFDR